MTNPLDESARAPDPGRTQTREGRGISMMIRSTYALHVGTGLIMEGLN